MCSNLAVCLFTNFIKPTCRPKECCLWFVYLPAFVCLYVYPCAGMGLHVREGVVVHDIHCGPKFYKLKLLGNLVI